MNENTATTGNELKERYLYATSRHLPSKQREDIRMEISGLIDDMLADRFAGRESEADSVRAVLSELGEPASLAGKYSDRKAYLIGPEYFGAYRSILKIVLAAVLGGVLIAMLLKGMVDPPDNYALFALDLLSSLMNAAFQGLAWVTIIFAVIEHFSGMPAKSMDVKADRSTPAGSAGTKALRNPQAWIPDDLPPVPKQQNLIKKSESIIAIVFGVLFLVLLNTAPQIFGFIYSADRDVTIVPFFDMDHFMDFLPLINIIICLGFLKEALKMLEGKYTIRLCIATSILGACSMIMTFSLILNPLLWNPALSADFAAFLDTVGMEDITPERLISGVWIGIVCLSVIGFTAETISGFYKAARYR